MNTHKVDFFQVWLRFIMLIRGYLWKIFSYIIIKKITFNGLVFCIGWPKFTHSLGEINIGKSVFLGKGVLKVINNARLFIGDNTLINNGFVISCESVIKIGKNVLIGEYVSIRDSDHIFEDKSLLISKQGMVSENIIINDDVWIGRGVVILKGITIGKGSVIAANSVVNKNVEEYSIYGGVPAKFLKKRG